MAAHIEQFYLGCLAHASYLIASDGEAAVIDPQRDIDLYIDRAVRDNLRIRYVIETHLHADFVSGHRELAERTGARICLGSNAGARFDHLPVRDGESVALGRCTLRFLETPGHTIESICIVLDDPDSQPRESAVFTGDTLFVGDVGRPDLSPSHTPQQLAALLYDSLHGKLLKLPGDTRIFPAHGAGSLCGRQMSSERSSTISRERLGNYALRASSREEFVQLLTADLPPRPEYFLQDVELNRSGARPLEELPPLAQLSPEQVLQLRENPDVVLLDTRPVIEFAVGHIPRAIHIGLSGQFASWAARLLGLDKRYVIIAEDSGKAEESRKRLARVGIENVIGYLEGGMIRWIGASFPTEFVPQLSAEELAQWMSDSFQSFTVLDVREPGEWSGGVLQGARRIPLGQLASRASELPQDQWIFVHCKGGYRSSIASSILRASGFGQTANITGGFDAWKSAKLPSVEVPS